MTDFLKAERLTSSKWRILAIPFGGPIDGKDTDGEFFSAKTDIKPHWFDRRPAIWHHNLDQTMKADSEIGTTDDLDLEDDGWWATLWLDRAHRYWQQIDEWLQQGKAYGSSGTLPHFVRTDHKTGEILSWPYVEQTVTLTPANFYSRPAKTIADSFKAAGIGLTVEQSGLLIPDLDSPTADLPDLASAGDAEAMRRRLGALLEAEEARLKTI